MKILIIVAACIVLQSSSCNKKTPLGPLVIPSSLFFIVKENGFRLPDSTLNNMKLYYYQSGLKKYVQDFGRASDEGHTLGVLVTRDVGFLSGDDNIKTYYLEYPNGMQDTLFVDYKHVGGNEPYNNSCYCVYPLQFVKFNGQISSPDPSITQQKVYLFNK